MGHAGLPPMLGHRTLQRALPQAPLRVLLHSARVPGPVHFLPVAADHCPVIRWRIALGGRRRCRGKLGPRQFPWTSRRSSSTTTPSTFARTRVLGAVRQAQAARFHLVVYFPGQCRLRDAEGDEGRRLPVADRRLRVGGSADSEEHQEGCDSRAGVASSPVTPTRLGLTIHGDFIVGLPGETRETIRRSLGIRQAP